MAELSHQLFGAHPSIRSPAQEKQEGDERAHPSVANNNNENTFCNGTNGNGAHLSFEASSLRNEMDSDSERLVTVVSAHPSLENASLVEENHEINSCNSAHHSQVNSAHPSLVYEKPSSNSDQLLENNTAHPSIVDGNINTSLVEVFHEIERLFDAPPNFISSAHLSFKHTSLVSEINNSNSDKPAIVNGAHPSLPSSFEHQAITLGELDSESLFSANPTSVISSIQPSSMKGEILEERLLKSDVSLTNSAHPSSFLRKMTNEKTNIVDEIAEIKEDNLLRAYSNLFHSKITNLVETKAEVEEESERAHPSFANPVHEDFRAYLQWFSAVYQPGMQLGRNKPPEATAEPGSENEAPEVRLSGEELLERVSSALNASSSDNELILRELSDIRHLLLQQLLAQTTGSGGGGEVTEPEAAALKMLTKEISFPVGEWSWSGCRVCLERKGLFARPCCSLPVCEECLQRYLATRVGEGAVKIQCCNPECQVFVPRDEISACLDAPDKARFYHFLARANADPWVKTCPRCSHLTAFAKVKPSLMKNTHKHPVRSRVVCGECALTWCFACHAPWHPGFTCKQYRKGDRLMKSWANEIHHGQLNAQKCPKCQVYIQRSTGCDHMHCTRCECDFCYRCGDRLRKLRFFGDHYSKLSVFGCKYRYKADQPLQRKLVRGAVFGSKLMVAPLLGTLGACAGVIALGFGIFILPVYGGVRLYQKFSPKLM